MSIYIINPNSSRVVTDGIDRAMEPLRAASPVPIAAIQLDEGPKGIETQAHVDGVVAPLLTRAAALEDSASAFVVACFSDPGLAALREQSRLPVLGIAESAVLTAMTMGQRFGIFSILSRSVPRHMRMLGAMGVMDRLAADLPLEMGVADLTDRNRTGPAPVSFRSFESDTRHQGDRIWQRYTATSSSGMQFASRSRVV